MEYPQSTIFFLPCKPPGAAMSRRHTPYEQHVTRILAHLTGALETYMTRYPHTPVGACLEASEELLLILESWVDALDGTIWANDYEA